MFHKVNMVEEEEEPCRACGAIIILCVHKMRQIIHSFLFLLAHAGWDVLYV